MTKEKFQARNCAKAIVDMYNGDMYKDEEDGDKYSDESIDKWTEQEAKKFCIEHIISMICSIFSNGGSEWLWGTELGVIKDLELYDEIGITKEEVEERLKKYI